MFYKQLLKICTLNNTSPTTTVISLGYSKGSLTNWKNGTIPNGDIVVRFAKHFGVTTDYFLLGDESALSGDNASNDKLTFDEQSLLNTYRDLTSIGKTKMLDISKEIWSDYRLYNNETESRLDPDAEFKKIMDKRAKYTQARHTRKEEDNETVKITVAAFGGIGREEINISKETADKAEKELDKITKRKNKGI